MQELLERDQLDRLSGKKLKHYEVTYRLSDDGTATQPYNTRYAPMIAAIKSLPVHSTHSATSTYIVKSHIPTAKGLASYIERSLEKGKDILNVIEVDPANKYAF